MNKVCCCCCCYKTNLNLVIFASTYLREALLLRFHKPVLSDFNVEDLLEGEYCNY